MNLIDIIHRKSPPEPWTEGEKIPWNDPDFSERMLSEHLSQEHDAASRGFEIIDKQVKWIHHNLLSGKATKVLDLGCGPGFYSSRLSALGHQCVGIDFSPASIAYARQQAQAADLASSYIQQDIRSAEFGKGYGLAMLIFGEFNVFKPADAIIILEKAYQALLPAGFLLLEPHTFEAIYGLGNQPASWYSAEKGLFSQRPHIVLQENSWYSASGTAIQRFYVIDTAIAEVTRHSSCNQAYSNEEYRAIFNGLRL